MTGSVLVFVLEVFFFLHFSDLLHVSVSSIGSSLLYLLKNLIYHTLNW